MRILNNRNLLAFYINKLLSSVFDTIIKQLNYCNIQIMNRETWVKNSYRFKLLKFIQLFILF